MNQAEVVGRVGLFQCHTMKKPQLKVRIVHFLGRFSTCTQSELSSSLKATRPAIKSAVKGLLDYKIIQIVDYGINGHKETVYKLAPFAHNS